MFYILSKIIGLFISPFIWIFTLLLFGLFSKSGKRKKRFFLWAVVLLYFFSNSFIFNEILLKWEPPAKADSELKPDYNYGIVLSGMVWYDTETDRINFMQSSDRIWQAVRLYAEGRIEKILITGGKADFFDRDTIESALLKNFLIQIGIPDSAVVTEELSRNTHENAVNTARLLQNLPHENLLLITSASHMRRANRCFEKAGLYCDIYPTDHNSGTRRFNPVIMLFPDVQTLFHWNEFIHEIFGMISYKFSGYI